MRNRTKTTNNTMSNTTMYRSTKIIHAKIIESFGTYNEHTIIINFYDKTNIIVGKEWAKEVGLKSLGFYVIDSDGNRTFLTKEEVYENFEECIDIPIRSKEVSSQQRTEALEKIAEAADAFIKVRDNKQIDIKRTQNMIIAQKELEDAVWNLRKFGPE